MWIDEDALTAKSQSTQVLYQLNYKLSYYISLLLYSHGLVVESFSIAAEDSAAFFLSLPRSSRFRARSSAFFNSSSLASNSSKRHRACKSKVLSDGGKVKGREGYRLGIASSGNTLGSYISLREFWGLDGPDLSLEARNDDEEEEDDDVVADAGWVDPCQRRTVGATKLWMITNIRPMIASAAAATVLVDFVMVDRWMLKPWQCFLGQTKWPNRQSRFYEAHFVDGGDERLVVDEFF